jgi:hypothetical protein
MKENSINYSIIKDAEDLPSSWDRIANSPFQQKKFLIHAQKYNYCNQRYYLLSQNGNLMCSAVVYTLKINFLNFLRIPSPIKMNIIGIPCSVSASGIIGDERSNKKSSYNLIKYIIEHEKGFLLNLNLNSEYIDNSWASGKTLPTIIFENRFKNWDDYLIAIKSRYRRRIKKFQTKLKGINISKSDCSCFSTKCHQLYLNVYEKSKDKLEELSAVFFKNLPQEYKLTVFCKGLVKNAEPLGWFITIFDGSVLSFFLGGLDYYQNRKFSIYHNMLIEILKEGIELGANSIDFGQTAETSKLKIGGKLKHKYMIGYHSNRFINWVLKKAKGVLEYKYNMPQYHVFKMSPD